MKECPTCGASAPDSATQCPSCQREFEEGSGISPVETAEPPAGGPGTAADSGPSMPGMEASEPESSEEVKSTNFGLPTSGPSEDDADDSDTESGDDGTTTQFGLPSSEEQAPEEEASVPDSPEEIDDSALDWSDFDDELEETEGPDSTLLSVWGISAEGSVATTPPDGEEASEPSASTSERGEETASEPSQPPRTSDDEDDDKRTQMGMPRFDPDQVSDESGAPERSGSLGDEATAPGAPQQSAAVGFDEADRPGTREVDAHSLEERARELQESDDPSSESGEQSGGGAETASSDGTPSSGVARVEPVAEPDDLDDPGTDDPEGTFRGKPLQVGARGSKEAAAETGSAHEESGDDDQTEEGSEGPELLLGEGGYLRSGEESEEEEEPERSPRKRKRTDVKSPSDTMRGSPADSRAGSEGSSSPEEPAGEALRERDGRAEDSTSKGPDSSALLGPESTDSEDPEGPSSQSQESSPEEVFQAIEEDASDAFSDEELEHVGEMDVEIDDDAVGDEFEFFDGAGTAAPNASGEQEHSEAQEPTATPPRSVDARELGEVDGESEGASAVEVDEVEETPEEFDETAPVDSTEISALGGAPAGGRTQDVVAVGSGLAFAGYLGFETAASGLPSHFLVVALTVAAGLFATTNLVVPFISADSGPKTGLYAGSGLLVGGLSVATLLLAGEGLQTAPLIALGGSILAVVAGLIPTFTTPQYDDF